MPSEWTEELQELKARLEKFAIDLASFNYKLQGYIKDFSPESSAMFPEICDLGFLFREFGDQAKDLSTTANVWEEKLSTVLCLGCVAKTMQTGEEETIKGELASGTPKVEQQPKLPKRGTPEHAQLCNYYGIEPQNAYLFAPHFVAFSELLTKLAEEGKPIPPGIVGKYEKFGMRYRRKKVD